MHIIELKNYDRSIIYNLPIKPSPNLPNKKSINLYPSLCLFEGTNVSIGRGTNMQFQIYGSPYLDKNLNTFSFKPFPNLGSKNPKHKGTLCFGKDLKNNKKLNEIDLSFIINAFNDSDKKNSFFNNYFIKLVGTENLKNQIINNISQNDIKRSWETKLNKFKLVREKYLVYKN